MSLLATYFLFVLFILLCVIWSGTSADIMKVGGYKLSALEIESVLLQVTTCVLYISILEPLLLSTGLPSRE